jgi:predicted permease
VPLRAGREFTVRDNAAAPRVAVVNEAFAKRYFGGKNPVGRRFVLGTTEHPLFAEIVGMVAECREDVRNRAAKAFYFPYEQRWGGDRMTFYLRTAADDQRIASQVRKVVRAADANVPVSNLNWMTVKVNGAIYSDRLIAVLALAFGVLATLLAAVGLYGVMAYAVVRRTAEIGVRLAMGARPSDVLRMVLKEAARLVAGGIVTGIACTFALSRLIASQLFGVKAYDLSIFSGAAAILAVVAMAAAFVPGWKASRIDPVSALKYD